MQFSSRNPWMRLFALITFLVVMAVAWYLISPLFIDRQVSEAFPTLSRMPTKTPRVEPTQVAILEATADSGFDSAEATAAMQLAMTEVPDASVEDMPENDGAEMIVLVSGSFYDIAHEGQGTATIYQLADGSRVLRFENFEVLNGPDLHVYLTTQSTIPDGGFDKLAGEVDLGALKGNIGDQNYTIPEGLDLDQIRSVVIWCVPFRVAFNAAPLN